MFNAAVAAFHGTFQSLYNTYSLTVTVVVVDAAAVRTLFHHNIIYITVSDTHGGRRIAIVRTYIRSFHSCASFFALHSIQFFQVFLFFSGFSTEQFEIDDRERESGTKNATAIQPTTTPYQRSSSKAETHK